MRFAVAENNGGGWKTKNTERFLKIFCETESSFDGLLKDPFLIFLFDAFVLVLLIHNVSTKEQSQLYILAKRHQTAAKRFTVGTEI